MGHLSDLIVTNTRLSMGLADMLLKGVFADRFARFTSPGGDPIHTNHPAFVLGHLSIYPQRALGDFLGLEVGNAKVPERYPELFGAGVECKDDPSGTIYPPMDEIVNYFRASHTDLMAKIPAVSDETLAQVNPNERFRERCPTTGQAIAFLMGSHAMMHLGQFSAWRRCEGLGAAM